MNYSQNFNHEFNTKLKERANLDEEEKMRLQEEMEAKLKAIEEMEERERVKNEELTKWQSEVSANKVLFQTILNSLNFQSKNLKVSAQYPRLKFLDLKRHI